MNELKRPEVPTYYLKDATRDQLEAYVFAMQIYADELESKLETEMDLAYEKGECE